MSVRSLWKVGKSTAYLALSLISLMPIHRAIRVLSLLKPGSFCWRAGWPYCLNWFIWSTRETVKLW